jgi:KTSC domain
MGLFKSLKQRLFGDKEKPVFKPHRGQKEADVEAGGQAQRRRKLLERTGRVDASGQTQYPNRKKISSEAGLQGEWGNSSPFLEAFLDGGILSQFASSNVWAICWDRTKNRLHVQFMAGKGKKKSGPGTWYSYANVAIAEAKIAFNTASKGIFTWDHLRRGKKSFTKNDPPPSYLPLGQKKRGNILQSP